MSTSFPFKVLAFAGEIEFQHCEHSMLFSVNDPRLLIWQTQGGERPLQAKIKTTPHNSVFVGSVCREVSRLP